MPEATCLFKGKALSLHKTKEGYAEIILDLDGESVNKFDRLTLGDLRHAVDEIKKIENDLKGLLISSAKNVFVVGADITEFEGHFGSTDEELSRWLQATHHIFNDIEDLRFPSVALINGLALGGGFEVCLASTYRVATNEASVGLPEVKLGIYPGWGGTIRLPRLIGADNAIEWIAGGKTYKAHEALAFGAIDAVVSADKLREAGLALLERAGQGDTSWHARREEKQKPLMLRTMIEAAMVFEGGKAFVKAKAGRNYPAPVEAIKVMQKTAGMTRDKAIPIEINGFVTLAKTPVAASLVGIFLADQFVKKKSKQLAKASTEPIHHATVLGAGIMGGGIAYQSASKGTPILMKDISESALELGMSEANKLLNKQLKRGKIDGETFGQILGSITPALSYSDISRSQIVVEAVVENEKVKGQVLREVEAQVKPGTVLASNTSTISISRLGENLQRPEDFCGMHFFNPVHRMPLVEVIRGAKTSDATIARTVAYAQAMGKTPIVVGDCPGFLVNRVLFPYFGGLNTLLEDGVDYQRIDKVMTDYGWPMGPCHLLDVVGIDTAVHAAEVMSQGFPDRMSYSREPVIARFYKEGRFGQKNKKGFYLYELDRKGKLKKTTDPTTSAFLAASVVEDNSSQISDEDIVARLMVPMWNEAARCLDENIVSSAMELDLALVYGIGFPPFRGGLMRELDRKGLKVFIAEAEALNKYGAVFEPTDQLKAMAAAGQTFYT